MFKILALAGLMVAGTAKASDYSLNLTDIDAYEFMVPNKIFIDTYKNEHVHDPYLAPDDSTLGLGASFNINFDLIRYQNESLLYMDNNLHFDQAAGSGQIRAAGWQYGLNLVLFRVNHFAKIEAFHQHHSQHILDREREDMHFPIYDRDGVRVILYEKGQ